MADEYCAEYSDISVFLYPVWKKLYRENGLCNHFAFGVALSDTGDRYVRDYMLAALFGGAFTGIGMALVLKAGATTGGTDMVAAIIQSHMRHYTVVQVMQVLDAAIVILGLYVFGLRPTLYAVVSIFVSTKISDAFLEGFKTSKAAFIITNRYEEVAEQLMDELDRGVTGLHAQGMYTEEKKCVLYCVVSRKEIVRVKEIVNDVDSSAFVIVSDVREVLGEGFLEYSDDF